MPQFKWVLKLIPSFNIYISCIVSNTNPMKGPNDLKTSFLRLHFHRRQKFSNASMPQFKWVSKLFPSFNISMSSILSNGNPKKGPNNLKTSFLRLHFHWRQRQKKHVGRGQQAGLESPKNKPSRLGLACSEKNSACWPLGVTKPAWNHPAWHGLFYKKGVPGLAWLGL